jgi:hypothetical protein
MVDLGADCSGDAAVALVVSAPLRQEKGRACGRG